MLRAVLASLILLVVFGCGGGSGGGVGVTVTPHEVSLSPGATQTFHATITDGSGSVDWTCSRGTISSDGLFTAPSTVGDVQVTATSTAYQNLSDTATVHIVQPSVSVSPATASVETSKTQQFTATVVGYADMSVQWSATGGGIDSNGLFTAGKVSGTYTVTATSNANSQLKATAQVTVHQPIAIAIDPTSVTLAPGATKTFSATVTGTEDTSVTWTCTAGTISGNGLYTAPTGAAGTFSVTATSNADPTKSASAVVNVTS